MKEEIQESNCNRYKISIADSSYHCIEVNDQQTTHFIAPDTKSGIQKLYIIKEGEEIYYVGITSQSMISRLRIGFIDNGHYGYHGYKWKDKLKKAELLVFTFPDIADNDDKARDHIEAVEAELVYYIREKTGSWPKYQMEIHFHESSEDERQIARYILNQCFDLPK